MSEDGVAAKSSVNAWAVGCTDGSVGERHAAALWCGSYHAGGSVAAPSLLELVRRVMNAAAGLLAAGVVWIPRRRRAATLRLTQANQICRFLMGAS